MVKLILFDCDGTLVDSQHVIVETMNRTFRAEGLVPPTHEQTRSIVGLSLDDRHGGAGAGSGNDGSHQAGRALQGTVCRSPPG